MSMAGMKKVVGTMSAVEMDECGGDNEGSGDSLARCGQIGVVGMINMVELDEHCGLSKGSGDHEHGGVDEGGGDERGGVNEGSGD